MSKDLLTCELTSIEGAACLRMVETARIHHVERAGARVQPMKMVEGIAVTGVMARTPSRSGICSVPTSLSTLKRVPNACLALGGLDALGLDAGLQDMRISLTASASCGCDGIPPSLTIRRRFRLHGREMQQTAAYRETVELLMRLPLMRLGENNFREIVRRVQTKCITLDWPIYQMYSL